MRRASWYAFSMEATNHTQRQANRVAEVSDALDSMPRLKRDHIWKTAARIYAQDDVSFLQAFEQAIKHTVEVDNRCGIQCGREKLNYGTCSAHGREFGK